MAEVLFRYGDSSECKPTVVGSYSDIPEQYRGGIWGEKDHAFFANPKGLIKSLDGFDDSYRFIFDFQIKGATFRRLEQFSIVPQYDKFTVLLTNNITRNYIPLTRWILAHRMGHAHIHHAHLYKYEMTCALVSYWNAMFPEHQMRAANGKSLEFNDMAFFVNDESTRPAEFRAGEWLMRFTAASMTCRSARMMSLMNDLDVHAELYAQNIICNGVTLAEPETTLERLITLVDSNPAFSPNKGKLEALLSTCSVADAIAVRADVEENLSKFLTLHHETARGKLVWL